MSQRVTCHILPPSSQPRGSPKEQKKKRVGYRPSDFSWEASSCCRQKPLCLVPTPGFVSVMLSCLERRILTGGSSSELNGCTVCRRERTSAFDRGWLAAYRTHCLPSVFRLTQRHRQSTCQSLHTQSVFGLFCSPRTITALPPRMTKANAVIRSFLVNVLLASSDRKSSASRSTSAA